MSPVGRQALQQTAELQQLRPAPSSACITGLLPVLTWIALCHTVIAALLRSTSSEPPCFCCGSCHDSGLPGARSPLLSLLKAHEQLDQLHSPPEVLRRSRHCQLLKGTVRGLVPSMHTHSMQHAPA